MKIFALYLIMDLDNMFDSKLRIEQFYNTN